MSLHFGKWLGTGEGASLETSHTSRKHFWSVVFDEVGYLLVMPSATAERGLATAENILASYDWPAETEQLLILPGQSRQAEFPKNLSLHLQTNVLTFLENT